MRIAVVFLSALVVAWAPQALADSPCYSTAGVSCQGMQITTCPRGDFEQIRNGCGGSADYIWIVARDGSNSPIPGIPWTDFWITACDPAHQLCLCVEPIVADSITGMNGRTTFSGWLKASGCALSGGVWMAIQGTPIATDPSCRYKLCLPVVVKGPDLTGASGAPDCTVNLSDLVPFGVSYNKDQGVPNYNACCDFNDDNRCNLSDFAFFGQHYQHGCL